MPSSDRGASAGADGVATSSARPDGGAGFPPAFPHLRLSGLAHGELSARDAEELAALKRQIRERLGFFSEGYKERCLRRRLGVRMRARGVHSYAEYGALLNGDEAEARLLLDAITINVSKFFRNAEVWQLVRDVALPALAQLDTPSIEIWSAGAAAGEEAYSLAILVLELAESHGIDPRRFNILGTDVDRAILSAAARGEYGEFAFGETPPDVRERWFEGRDLRRVRPEVRRLVRFEPLDLIGEPFPRRRHLILCRNVVIYFERAVQERIFTQFHDALDPAGFLLLGKVEALFGANASLFRPVASRERLFRRR